MEGVIKQLRAELQVASQQVEELKSLGLQDAATRIAHPEVLLAQNEETIADQQQTVKNLVADNALLKRSLFGPRRERFGATDQTRTALAYIRQLFALEDMCELTIWNS